MAFEKFGRTKTEGVSPNTRESLAASHEVQSMLGELDSISDTSRRSARRMWDLRDRALETPLLQQDSESRREFWNKFQEKVSGMRSGIELMKKKEQFWEKWKTSSMGVAVGGAAVGVLGAAWQAKYGFDHTYMVEVLDHSLNGPMFAGFLSACTAVGSAGIGYMMETFRGDKARDLERGLQSFTD